jgi:hypothetical protein
VLFHPALVVLIVVQYPALLQMAPVLEVSPRPPASGAEDVHVLLHGREGGENVFEWKIDKLEGPGADDCG